LGASDCHEGASEASFESLDSPIFKYWSQDVEWNNINARLRS
jgi:hypothetical protein